ncbi:MAG: SDR family NAD(P)-dependent oxidoreductase, partial [Candidatus Methanomethyliaceae archaeon]
MAYCVDLSGKTAFITGSTKGIGYGLALALARAGASIVVTSRHLDECEQVCGVIGDMGVKAFPVVLDVRSRASIEAAVGRAVSYFGALDILVNNAGAAVTKKAEDLSEEEWNLIIDTNLKGVFF